MKAVVTLFFLFSLSVATKIYAQGCSDAGFCTIGSLKPHGTASAWYKVSNKFTIGLTGGVPFVVRDVRPDGLTRKFVISPEFIVNF